LDLDHLLKQSYRFGSEPQTPMGFSDFQQQRGTRVSLLGHSSMSMKQTNDRPIIMRGDRGLNPGYQERR
jgi:hypothetical protein